MKFFVIQRPDSGSKVVFVKPANVVGLTTHQSETVLKKLEPEVFQRMVQSVLNRTEIMSTVCQGCCLVHSVRGMNYPDCEKCKEDDYAIEALVALGKGTVFIFQPALPEENSPEENEIAAKDELH